MGIIKTINKPARPFRPTNSGQTLTPEEKFVTKSKFISASIAIAAALVGANAGAAVVDLSNGSGTINGALFTTDFGQPAGTGVFEPFLTIQNDPWEQGYNSSNGNFDTKREPQWNHEIRLSDLRITSVNGTQYFGFVVDVNEPGGNKATISLNALRIWTSPTLQNSTSTNSSGYFNGSLGTLRFDLGAGNTVLYNDKNRGSGQSDIAIYIPVSNFANVGLNDYVYMYQRWGNTDATQGGFEETRIMQGIAPIPEMNALFPIIGLATAVGATHVLRRRKMAKMSS